MVRGKWILIAGVVVFVSAGIGAWTLWRRQSAPPPKPPVAAEPAPGTEIRLTGVIRAVYLLQIPAPIDGIAEEFAVKPGDEVFEGQILGRIASDTLKENERETALEEERAAARLNQLESELISARLEESRVSADLARARGESQKLERAYARQQLLMKEGATPRKVFEKSRDDFNAAKGESETLEALARQASDRVAQALRDIEAAKKEMEERKAAHDAAKAELAAADILAPVDGVITAIKKNAGEEVQKTMPDLIEMSPDLSVLELVVEADPKTVKRIKPGQPAALLLAELPAPLECPVKNVDGEKIVIEFSSPTTAIRPGMSATVLLKLN
jgi:multidrug efflux pump subunit AcrA (membrane-fusion protein)